MHESPYQVLYGTRGGKNPGPDGGGAGKRFNFSMRSSLFSRAFSCSKALTSSSSSAISSRRSASLNPRTLLHRARGSPPQDRGKADTTNRSSLHRRSDLPGARALPHFFRLALVVTRIGNLSAATRAFDDHSSSSSVQYIACMRLASIGTAYTCWAHRVKAFNLSGSRGPPEPS